MGVRLYRRYWRVTVGRPLGPGATDLQELIDFGDLRVVFHVERSHKPDPNKAALSLYNLAETTRSKLTGKGLSMTLEAGFIDHSAMILRADIARVSHGRDGPDWVTKLEADDGGRALAQQRVSLALEAGAKVTDVIKSIGSRMNVAVSNALNNIKEGDFGRTLTEFTNGLALSGQAGREMDKAMRAAGLEWSIQNNELVITKSGQPTTDQAVVLGSDTGLIGSPEPGEEGALQVRALIVPGLEPPRKVKIESRTFNGFARVERVKYSGDSHGEDWFAELEVKPL